MIILKGQLVIGAAIQWVWNRRRKKLEHDYVKAGWALSVYPEVRNDARNSLGGDVQKKRYSAWSRGYTAILAQRT